MWFSACLQVSAGGSLANTLVGLGQLTAAQERSDSSSSTPASTASTDSVRVGMTGCVGGSDALGEFARAQLQAAGVDVVDPGPTSNATGVVMVFTTPDAQRSFLSSFSSEDSLHMSQQLQDAAASARLLLIEGYMWETEGAAEAIPALVRHARSVGTLVALTAGDAGVVERHGAKVRAVIHQCLLLGCVSGAAHMRGTASCHACAALHCCRLFRIICGTVCRPQLAGVESLLLPWCMLTSAMRVLLLLSSGAASDCCWCGHLVWQRGRGSRAGAAPACAAG